MFLLFVAISSFGAGGYVAGRMQALSRLSITSESEFRDGLHGVVTWGLTLTLTALLALGGVAVASRATGPSGGALGPITSAAGEGTIATELDELFRGDHGTTETTAAYRRAEASRILMRSSGHVGLSDDDRSYLAEIVRSQTGLATLPTAERVNRITADVKQELHRARQAAVMQAFLAAAALMVGLAVAWFTAVEGGREYERKTVPLLYRSLR